MGRVSLVSGDALKGEGSRCLWRIRHLGGERKHSEWRQKLARCVHTL